MRGEGPRGQTHAVDAHCKCAPARILTVHSPNGDLILIHCPLSLIKWVVERQNVGFAIRAWWQGCPKHDRPPRKPRPTCARASSMNRLSSSVQFVSSMCTNVVNMGRNQAWASRTATREASEKCRGYKVFGVQMRTWMQIDAQSNIRNGVFVHECRLCKRRHLPVCRPLSLVHGGTKRAATTLPWPEALADSTQATWPGSADPISTHPAHHPKPIETCCALMCIHVAPRCMSLCQAQP